MQFVSLENGIGGPGVSAFCLEANNNEALLKKASDLGLISEENIMIGGVKFLLS